MVPQKEFLLPLLQAQQNILITNRTFSRAEVLAHKFNHFGTIEALIRTYSGANI